MHPPRVFSRQISRVGLEWISVERTALDLMSARVRYVLFAGRTGIGKAWDKVDTPPASLEFMSDEIAQYVAL